MSRMATITDRESAQIEAANASGRTSAVFIHGLRLLPSSWDNWGRAARPDHRGARALGGYGGDRPGPVPRGANVLSDEGARQLYETYHVAAPGIALNQMANANLNPFTEAKADTKNPCRGPLLTIDGEKDHTVPWAIASASHKRQKRNPGVTEIVKIPNRGHSLTIDSGWREVAQTSLDSVKRFA